MELATSAISTMPRDYFALVSYVPDPLASLLAGLRKNLPGGPHPEAHITFLPPRPLALATEKAALEIDRLLHFVRPFELELGEVCLFPETRILYLDIKSGCQDMLRLHGCLNQGKLSADEAFEYIPHLTLGGPIPPDQLEVTSRQTIDAWETLASSRHFVIDEVVLLRQSEIGNLGWSRISSHRLLCKPTTQT